MKQKTYPLNISRQIDTNFRNYALYVLENRGIPNFYDALTNVQRFIMINAPASYNKTMSLVGSCMSDGYHHGDASLTKAINRLARPFGNSEQLLNGDGFFGSPVTQEASAARYTSIRINPTIADMIRKNNFLNTRDDEGSYDPLWVDLPIGLTNTIVGIAVGYKSTVLPRSLSQVQQFLDGEIKELIPYFKGFNGNVTRYKGMNKTWLIEGRIEINQKAKSIRVVELPPLMKYGSFLKKLDSIISGYNVRLINNSLNEIDLTVTLSGSKEDWENFVIEVDRATKMLVTETPIFVKDGLVIEYEKIEDYINDFRYRLGDLKVRKLTYYMNVTDEELLFQKFKEKYLLFMLEGKAKKMRTDVEIDEFLTELTVGYPNVRRRLDSIYLKSLSEDELKRTQKKIKDLTTELAKQKKDLAAAVKAFEKMTDTSLTRATTNRANSVTNLFAEEDEIDGIEVFGSSNTYESEDEEVEADEN